MNCAAIENHILFPTDDDSEWDKDHRDFVLNILLPMVRPRAEVDRVIREAYEAGFEAKSNGSSVVPDGAYEYGNIKDPMGVAHDYLFWLHHKGLPDKTGKVWTLWECNVWYLHAWQDFEHPVVGWTWFTGLTLGSWYVWHFGKEEKKNNPSANPPAPGNYGLRQA